MINSIFVMEIMCILGIISSIIGCIIGSYIKTDSKISFAMFLELTAGIMTGVVCFDMLPETFKIANMSFSLIGLAIGIFLIYIIDKFVYYNNKNKYTKIQKDLKYYIMQIVIVIAMSIDNIVEGIAIGSSLAYSTTLGYSIIISILIHNIPEGIIVGMSGKLSNKKRIKIVLDGIIIGIFLGIGAFIGNIIGNVSNISVAISMSIASGAMLYIVSCNLIPSSKNVIDSKKVHIMYIFGIILGAIIS